MSTTTAGGASDAGGVFRRETLDGTEYLVAPVTAHQEGVYLYPRANGRGIKREFLPGEELTDSADAWEGMPLTLSHPETADGGPGLIRHNGTTYTEVGLFRNVTPASDALGGETWIRANEVGAHDGVLQAYIDEVNATGRGEVSTGYEAATEFQRGEYNNQRYSYVQRNLDPDHLALLPHNEGNCSVDGGCGLGARPNMRAPAAPTSGLRLNHRAVLNVRSEARTPEFDGTETSSWGDVSKDLRAWADALGFEDVETVADLTDDQRSAVASHTLLGDPDAETWDELRFFPVVNPSTGALNEGALEAVLGGRGQSADIPQSAYESAASEAERLLDERFRDDDDDRENVGRSIEMPTDVDDPTSIGRHPRTHATVAHGDDGTDGGGVSESVRAELHDLHAKLNRLLRRDGGEPDGGAAGDVPGGGDDDAGGADDSDDSDPDMSDTQTKERLINEHGISEDVAEEVAGRECGDTILNALDAQTDDGGGGGDGGDGGTESPETPESPDGSGGGDGGGGGSTDDLPDAVVDTLEQQSEVIESLQDTVEDLKEARANEREAEEERLNETLESESELGEATIEAMSLDAKRAAVEDLGVDADGAGSGGGQGGEGQAVANMAGVRGQVDYEYEADDDGPDVPAAGRTNWEARKQAERGQEGDD